MMATGCMGAPGFHRSGQNDRPRASRRRPQDRHLPSFRPLPLSLPARATLSCIIAQAGSAIGGKGPPTVVQRNLVGMDRLSPWGAPQSRLACPGCVRNCQRGAGAKGSRADTTGPCGQQQPSCRHGPRCGAEWQVVRLHAGPWHWLRKPRCRPWHCGRGRRQRSNAAAGLDAERPLPNRTQAVRVLSRPARCDGQDAVSKD
jgi:hypothetical protein